MKRISILTLAVLCTGLLLSCGKESPELSDTNSDGQAANLISVSDLAPNYVYTLVGNPDKFTQEDGVGDKATFINLIQLVADDGYLYALDSYVVRKIRISDRTVTTLAGSTTGGFHRDGLGKDAILESPSSIALGPDGNLYVAELGQVSKVTKEGLVTTVAGSVRAYEDGPIKTAKFINLTSITVCDDGTIYVIDNQNFYQAGKVLLRKISTSGIVSTIASGPPNAGTFNWNINSLSVLHGTLYAGGTGIFKITTKGKVTTVKEGVPVFLNSLLAQEDGSFYISSNNQIKKISPTGTLTTLAGIPVTDQYGKPAEGPADSVDLHEPTGLTLYEKVLYICVHPHIAEIESPYLNQGHVIQMISVP